MMKREERRRGQLIWVGTVFVVMALAVGGCSRMSGKPSQQRTGALEKATLGVETSVLPAAVWVAEDKGYFQEAGLSLSIREFDSGRLSLLAMLKGEGIDICTVAPTPIMFNSFERRDFLIIATFVYSYDELKIIARKDKGINTGRDLRGKRIGTPARTTGAFVLGAFLTHNGLLASEVEVVDIDPSDLPTALENNQVDAIVIWEPHAFNAQKLLREKAIRLPTSEMYRTTFNFVVMEDFAKDHPEAPKRFLRAVDKASTFMQKHEEEAQAIVAKRLMTDKEVVTRVWDDFVFEISLEQSLLITLEDEARWAIRNKFTDETKVPDFMDLICLDIMDEVKPDAVSIIR